MNKKHIQNIVVFFPLLAIFVLTSCSSGSEKKVAEAPIPALKISVTDVVRRDMQDTVRFYGSVKLRRHVRLASQFDGRIKDFSLLPGDRVAKGDRIGTIIPPMREALLQIINELPQDKRALIQGEIKEVPLYSPINGTVLKVSRHTGDVVQRGEEIVHIGQLDVLDVYGDVPLEHLQQVNKLKEIEVSFVGYNVPPRKLKIEAVTGEMDMKKNTVPVRLRLDNPKNEFKPGMITRLSFPGQVHNDALVVPRSALLSEEGIYSVFVLKGANSVEKRVIKPGIMNTGLVEVTSGLSEGEKVAVTKVYSLVEEMKVEVTE